MYTSPNIDGWMKPEELDWLYTQALEMETIVEIGSYKGRSTHALLSAGAYVTAVDHFYGSAGEDAHARDAVADGIYRDFIANTGNAPNLCTVRLPSLHAATMFRDGAFDMVFIDADHRYEEVKKDILAWRPKAKRLLCGHDFSASWPGVLKAVTETLGAVEVYDSIWYQWLTR